MVKIVVANECVATKTELAASKKNETHHLASPSPHTDWLVYLLFYSRIGRPVQNQMNNAVCIFILQINQTICMPYMYRLN
jgi:hypothetical protein